MNWWGAGALMALLALVFAGYLVASRFGSEHAKDLHYAMESHMLAWDAVLAEDEPLPSWLKEALEVNETPELLRGWMKESARIGWTTDSLLTDWMVVCHRFSQHADRQAWLDEGGAALKEMTAPESDDIYRIAARKALQQQPLTDTERIRLQVLHETTAEQTWFMAHLARVHGLPADADSPGAVLRRKAALRGKIAAGAVAASVVALSLPCLGLAWWGLRKRARPARPSARRLFRLWSVPAVLGVWSLWHAASIILSFFLALAVAFLAAVLAELGAGWGQTAAMWFTMLVLGAGVAAIPVAMRYHLIRRKGVMTQAFGMPPRAFFSPHWIAIAFASAMAILGLLAVFEWGLKQAGVTVETLDHLTRSFRSMGEGAIPAAILWACVLAPFAEEIIFRGFIFGSMREHWGAPLAATASSVAFALIHAYGWLGTVSVFLYGLAFCYIFHRSGSLVPGILTHAFINLTIVTVNHLDSGV